jgi:AraC family transcriptional regulator
MKIYIKNMVCDRCVMAVRKQLEDLHIGYNSIQLGEVELTDEVKDEVLPVLATALEKIGFELLDDRKAKIVEKIKNTIIHLVHYEAEELNLKFSALLSDKLNLEYHYLSALFSSIEGITIEKYIILQRIEKAKELLMYDELNLSEIADRLGYSSVQHLSQQFKKTTGLTPSHFKQLRENKRKPIDKV